MQTYIFFVIDYSGRIAGRRGKAADYANEKTGNNKIKRSANPKRETGRRPPPRCLHYPQRQRPPLVLARIKPTAFRSHDAPRGAGRRGKERKLAAKRQTTEAISMAAEAPVRAPAAAARSARRPAVSASSASRLLLGHRPFLAQRFAAGRAAVAGPAAGLRPRPRRPRLSVVAMAATGERALFFFSYLLLSFRSLAGRVVAVVRWCESCRWRASVLCVDGVRGNDEESVSVELRFIAV